MCQTRCALHETRKEPTRRPRKGWFQACETDLDSTISGGSRRTRRQSTLDKLRDFVAATRFRESCGRCPASSSGCEVCCGGVPRSSAARPGASSRYKAPNGETRKINLRANRHIDRVLVRCCLTCGGRPRRLSQWKMAILPRSHRNDRDSSTSKARDIALIVAENVAE